VIIDWCRENMAAYKVPRVIEFIDALPKSGSGKIMWRELQERENAGATSAAASATTSQTAAQS
jgi:fatty-acyl-CoA synthase